MFISRVFKNNVYRVLIYRVFQKKRSVGDDRGVGGGKEDDKGERSDVKRDGG